MVTLLSELAHPGPHNKPSSSKLVMSLLCLVIVAWVPTMPASAPYEESLSYLPYNKSITCNVGTEWECLCSTAQGPGVVCSDLFTNIQAVSVHFDGCSFDLAKHIHRGQPYENYIKEYIAWWIREECSMGSCMEVDQRDLIDMKAQNIVLISLECAESKRTRLSFVALHSINGSLERNSSVEADQAWQLLPSSMIAMVLEARIHLLENIFSTNRLVIDLTLIKGSSGGRTNDKKGNPADSAASGTTALHKAIYISLALISSAIVICWTCSCFLCPRAARFDICKCWSNGEEKQNSSSPLVGNSSSSDCSELVRIETECRSLNEKR